MFNSVLKYTINLMRDDEGGVWIAASDDAGGLVLEADSLEVLIKRVRDTVLKMLLFKGKTGDTVLLSFRQVEYKKETEKNF